MVVRGVKSRAPGGRGRVIHTSYKVDSASRSRTSRTDDSSSDHHLVAAAAQPEADVFCGDQVQV